MLLLDTNPYFLDVAFNATVQVVLNNMDGGEHPIHLHGHTFAIIGIGEGVYNESVDAAGLLSNASDTPPIRDTVSIPPLSWAVIRFAADNPGVWLIHCHIDWHLANGLGATFIEHATTLQQTKTIPRDVLSLCNSDSYCNFWSRRRRYTRQRE